MPRIDNDIKLDFKDVLVRPKRSTLKSRSEVNNICTFVNKEAKNWSVGNYLALIHDVTLGLQDIA